MTTFFKHCTKLLAISILLLGCGDGRESRGEGSTDPDDTSTSTSTDSSTDTDSNTDDSDSGEDTGPITDPECDNEGEQYCDFECMIPNTDDHCGACNRKCGAGQVCTEMDDGTFDCDCPEGTVRCNGACTDPLTSAAYCGASGTCTGAEAGINCGAGGECTDGECGCISSLTWCGDACVDTLTNASYCTATADECGVQCMMGGVCVDGACGCPDTIPTECGDLGCVDTQNNDAACGGCVGDGGEACDTANGFTCQAGSCQCAPGTELCDGACTDTQSDPNNCGGCYNAGAGPGIQCGFVDTDSTIQQGCFIDTCVDSPCDPLVMGDLCDGLTLRDKSICLQSDDHFTTAGLKCDNNPSGIPADTAVCYEILDVPTFEMFRCWWSGRNLTVNNVLMACSNDGANYQALPSSVGGGYCVYFPPSSVGGAESDGFSMGIQ